LKQPSVRQPGTCQSHLHHGQGRCECFVTCCRTLGPGVLSPSIGTELESLLRGPIPTETFILPRPLAWAPRFECSCRAGALPCRASRAGPRGLRSLPGLCHWHGRPGGTVAVTEPSAVVWPVRQCPRRSRPSRRPIIMRLRESRRPRLSSYKQRRDPAQKNGTCAGRLPL
jgi:hypothetical protein